jgi:hypothetical protein
MSYNHDPASSGAVASGRGVTSYDTGYEHSQEHWLALQSLVDEADGQECDPPSALLANVAQA